jgi:hypothetical protein
MTPAQTAIIARRTVEGATTRDIEAQLGIDHSTIARTRNRPQVRALIESEIAALMERGLKPARRTLCRLAAIGNKADADKDMLKLSLDASKTILSHANGQPGTIINTLIQINQAPEQSQELAGISAFLASQWQQPAVEITNDHSENRTTIQNVNDGSEMTGIATPRTAGSQDAPDDPQAVDISEAKVEGNQHDSA